MTERGKSASGEEMDEEFWQRAEERAEAGLDTPRLGRRGRPLLGEKAAELTAVHLPPEVRRTLDDRAVQEHTTASDVIRRALERYLAS